jgi:Family of unknown function (DUF6982)
VRSRSPASTYKKVIVALSDHTRIHGYLNPSRLRLAEPVDLLTPEGEHRPLLLKDIRAIYFVREFTPDFQPGRKAFLSRPKLDGLWVRLRFFDNEILEGVLNNDLLAFLDSGIQITPPDLNGPALRILIPRTALAEMTVLGVVGIARRKPSASIPVQPKLFSE